ncbi:transmembrane E3 ubiquitin-protein ligase FLY1-like isoform X3 [Curcuma longa]|uniref:transmembrane E3 ubiquitin-protein ligase FLY1-like isoform X3 n=1 Tax=Curcuma longa TaxID=136217 RepID=UPI003D9F20B2
MEGRRGERWSLWGAAAVAVFLGLVSPLMALRPLKQRAFSVDGAWGEEQLFLRRDDSDSSFSPWNITGTYKGQWSFLDVTNGSSRFLNFGKSSGVSVLELVTTQTKIRGVHYVQGSITFHDVLDKEHDHGFAQMRLDGVYIWPFHKLRMMANSVPNNEPLQQDYFSNPYHLIGVFSSQVLQESIQDKLPTKKSLTNDIEKYCHIEIAAQVSQISSRQNDGNHELYHLEGLMEGPAMDGDGECFPSILLNATSLNTEAYYNKAVNYTLMVTFISFLQVLLLIRQMEHSNTQSGAAKVSILMIGQQAIMDAYLCLLNLTAGILVESLFNAFATAAFFKFVVFSIFEMRYLLAIWKASRPLQSGESWETMRRELSVLYSRFYGILLGGIVLLYHLHNFLRPVIFIMYSFWIPQIVTNVIQDTRKPLHPYYIIGMSVTRLAIPFYIFGCPSNFLRIEVDNYWCIWLGVFLGLQSLILLLQHYLGSRWFIPRQMLPEKYFYYRKFESYASQATDCVICMTTIDFTENSNRYMVTPCDHCFHSVCLQRWMDIKMECPTCRRALPPA